MTITRCKIHPAIGVARVGDSPDGFFVGPESPGDAGSDGPYKDGAGRIKRQAARFREAEVRPLLERGGADFFLHCGEWGQRTWTAMIYLNEPEDGGATRFKTIGKTIQPETGKLLTWNNLNPDGRPNGATLHQGMKVRRVTKYVLTKWFRELPRS